MLVHLKNYIILFSIYMLRLLLADDFTYEKAYE